MIGIAPKEWKTDLPEFCEKTRDFYAGKMDKGSYKGFSGRYGSYAQKGGAASMLRLRMTAGCVSKEKLAFIAKAIRAYQVNMVHFTTCESVQFHNLDEKSVCELMEQALDAGIVTMGGGGDFPRNVMCSPLSGVEEGEYFDVMPWAKAAGEYLMTFINAEKMPCPAAIHLQGVRQSLKGRQPPQAVLLLQQHLPGAAAQGQIRLAGSSGAVGQVIGMRGNVLNHG